MSSVTPLLLTHSLPTLYLPLPSIFPSPLSSPSLYLPLPSIFPSPLSSPLLYLPLSSIFPSPLSSPPLYLPLPSIFPSPLSSPPLYLPLPLSSPPLYLPLPSIIPSPLSSPPLYLPLPSIYLPHVSSELLFTSIYDTFSNEDNLSKAVFLEHLCSYIIEGKIRHVRTLIVKDFIGESQSIPNQQEQALLLVTTCVDKF